MLGLLTLERLSGPLQSANILYTLGRLSGPLRSATSYRWSALHQDGQQRKPGSGSAPIGKVCRCPKDEGRNKSNSECNDTLYPAYTWQKVPLKYQSLFKLCELGRPRIGVNTVNFTSWLPSLLDRVSRYIHTSIETWVNEELKTVDKIDSKLGGKTSEGGVLLLTETHLCQICGKAFSSAKGLKIHMYTHEQEMPIRCDICGKGFVTASELELHMRYTHREEKPFRCGVCGKGFKTAPRLASHMRRHTGEKPFSCTLCGEAFPTSVQLKRHLYTHGGEKPHHCDVCGQRFLSAQELLYHKRVHTGERPFSCHVCGKAFKQHGHLYHHMRTHSKHRAYVCELCGNSYKFKVTLVKHMESVHKGDVLEVEV